jgi:endonuclease/exonuclease/phosphatase (EEP) superfamily protein YafD
MENLNSMMRRILLAGLSLAALPLVGALLISLFSAWFPLADSLSHFRAHLLAAFILIAVGFVFLNSRKLVIAMAVSAIVAALTIYPAWPFLSPYAQLSHPLKLIQFNTLFSNPTPDRSLAWIKVEQPDFVMLQEVSSKTLAIYDGLTETMPYGVFCKFAPVGGVAVRSKFPLVNQGCVEKQGLVWMRADVNGTQMSFASVHLHWPWPFKQAKQLEWMQESLNAIPRPVVLTGDFNAAAWSEAVSKVAAASDTRVVPGLWFTLRMGPRPIGPIAFMPIDHVMMPDGFVVGDIAVGPALGSDHLPVVVMFQVR